MNHFFYRIILIFAFFLFDPKISLAAYQGWVVDAETKEPLQGAVALIEWIEAGTFMSLTTGYSAETLTDENGYFSIPNYGRSFNLFQSDNPLVRFIIFKSGYEYIGGYGWDYWLQKGQTGVHNEKFIWKTEDGKSFFQLLKRRTTLHPLLPSLPDRDPKQIKLLKAEIDKENSRIIPEVKITLPYSRSRIDRPDTVVTGTIPPLNGTFTFSLKIGGEVNVEHTPMIHGNQFAMNYAKLSPGTTNIFANLKDQYGGESKTSIEVTTGFEKASFIRLITDIDTAISPMSTVLNLESSLPSKITETSLYIAHLDQQIYYLPPKLKFIETKEGRRVIGIGMGLETPREIDFIKSNITNYDAITFPFHLVIPVSGIYLATVTAKTEDSKVYTSQLALNVLDSIIVSPTQNQTNKK